MMALLQFDCWPGVASKMGAVSNCETSVWKNWTSKSLQPCSLLLLPAAGCLKAWVPCGGWETQLKDGLSSVVRAKAKKPRLG